MAMELRSMNLNNAQAFLFDQHHSQFPLSRYHRAEDVRKWVEETQRIKEMRDGLENGNKVGTGETAAGKYEDKWEDVADLRSKILFVARNKFAMFMFINFISFQAHKPRLAHSGNLRDIMTRKMGRRTIESSFLLHVNELSYFLFRD